MRTALLTLSVCVLALPANAQYSGGTGEPNDPYQIATAGDLIALGETPEDYDKHFILTADIDLDPNLPGRKVFDKAVIAPDTNDTEYWFQGTSFAGVFEGRGHTISHLTITGGSYLGLFGQLGQAEVENLGVVDARIVGSGGYVGGLVGQNMLSTVTECWSTGMVSGDRNVGGLMGLMGTNHTQAGSLTAVIHCYSTAAVSGGDNVGGLLGYNSEGIVSNCHSTGTINGGSFVGGLLGYNSKGIVSNCHSTDAVGGSEWVGGLVGLNVGGCIVTSYNSGPVTGASQVGGLVGDNGCFGYADGTVTDGNVAGCWSTGTIAGKRSVGGLVGHNAGNVVDCYAKGSVSGDSRVGGLVGVNWGGGFYHRDKPGHVARSYSVGCVDGQTGVGGLVGDNYLGSVISSFWDVETSAQGSSPGGTGKTTAEMQIASTFLDAGWDFVGETANGTEDIWKIAEGLGYPRLSWEKYGGGTGEPNDPYQIATAADLIALGETPDDYDKHFILTADIDLDPNLPGRKVFDRAVIGPDGTTSFTGVFDGGGHTISHLRITGAGYLGLFGQVGHWSGYQGEVRDVALLGVTISGSGSYIGGLAGQNNGTIHGCHVAGTVTSQGGYLHSVGGLVGQNRGNIVSSHSAGAVTATGDCIGGLVGQNGVGGSGRGSRWASVAESYSTASVGGGNCVGGLVGLNDNGTVDHCYSAGSVGGDQGVGGLVGSNADAVTHCYSTGPVSGASSVGGVVGSNWGTVRACYSAGSVTGDEAVGGLVGLSEGAVIAGFWDIEASGQAASAGGLGRTTSQMQTATTFALWGASGPFWTIDEGHDYPHLAWEGAPGEIIAGPSYGGGTGTGQDPYLIATAEHLNTMGLIWCYGDKQFKLTADIDLSAYDGKEGRPAFYPIGQGDDFSGVFDGGGHTISGLTLSGGGNLGLFARLSPEAEVRGLGVVDVNITGSGDNIGGLAGRNGGRVIHCYCTGAVRGSFSVGGFVGANSGMVTGCYARATVAGRNSIGGLVGSNSGVVAHSYCTGLVTGDSRVGGLVGDGVPAGVMHAVWDMDTSGLSMSGGAVGLTTAEMMDPYMLGLNGFADDPNWTLDAGRDYPRLAWEGTSGQIIPEPDVDWLEGRGTADEPYRIDVADQLILLGKASLLWDRDFVLGADIDLDPNLAGGMVFGQAVVSVFSGVFDGNDHAISHLTIRGGGYLGLFGCLLDPNSEIRNLPLIDPNVAGKDYLGALVGRLEEGTVTNCHVTGVSISGTYRVGGLVGSHLNGTISDCSVACGRVSGDSDVGGLGGEGSRNGGAVVRSSVQDVDVLAKTDFFGFGRAGGLVAYAGTGRIQDCRVTGGFVHALGEVGGLVGYVYKGIVSRCASSAGVEVGPDRNDVWFLRFNAGGLVGCNGGTIEDCYATGSVSQNSFPDIGRSYALFPLGVGGLVGLNGTGTVTRSYSAGTVNAHEYCGGLVGSRMILGDVNVCFWDIQNSGQTRSAGGIGKTTAEMQRASTFLEAGWDFVGETANGSEDIWWIEEGQDYPRLWWELYIDE